jgi:protein-disulfide isomerase
MPAATPSPEIAAPEDHARGAATAALTIVEYGDLECPSCRQAYPAVEHLLADHPQEVRFVYRHFPQQEVHPHAQLAAEAVEAAGAQGRFWPYFDLLYTRTGAFSRTTLLHYAEELGLDRARFEHDLDAHAHLPRVLANLELGRRAGVRATPGFFLNGHVVDVSFGVQHLQEAVAAALRAPAP